MRWLSVGVLGDDLASSGVAWLVGAARATGIEWEDFSGFHAGLRQTAGEVTVVQEMLGRKAAGRTERRGGFQAPGWDGSVEAHAPCRGAGDGGAA